MQLSKGNMLDIAPSNDHKILVTTNSYIKKDGSLVMGRGAAKQLRDDVPGIDKQLGCRVNHMTYYGIILLANGYGAFQVKNHFKAEAELALIWESTRRLSTLCWYMPDTTFHINFPGIGNGKLERSKVLPYVDKLPDNVVVWELE